MDTFKGAGGDECEGVDTFKGEGGDECEGVDTFKGVGVVGACAFCLYVMDCCVLPHFIE